MQQQASEPFRSVILAGERPGGSPLSQVFNVSASVMVPVAGRPSLDYVIQAIADSERADGGIICGPTSDAVARSEEMQALLRHPDYTWLEQAAGPAASALAALEKLGHFPALLTAGDHALLTAEIVDHFCKQALLHGNNFQCDLVIGFVPYPLVQAEWPESRRTVLKFSDGKFCGSNLFAVMSPDGRKALKFWRQAEADRKHPWRIARRFGIRALVRYLFRRLSLKDALQALSEAAGCRIGYVELGYARAAVDVDSVEDQKLADKILSGNSP